MKHCIFTDDYNTYRQWAIDNLKENSIEPTDTNIADEIYDLMSFVLEDEKDILDYKADIIAIADLGLWNGRVKGYRLFNNLNEIFNCMQDSNDFYLEGVTLKATCYHHDGVNYIKFYIFNRDLAGSDDFLNDIYYNRPISKSRFYKYCKSAGKIVRKIYGL